MTFFSRRRFLAAAPCMVGALALFGAERPAEAQLTGGFERQTSSFVTSEETAVQSDFWLMEVQLKPMRMVWIETTDPATGAVGKEPVLYLAWRAIRRPAVGLDPAGAAPVNEQDPEPGPQQFIPEFLLITYDNPQSEIPMQALPDSILPKAMEEIRRIERSPYLDAVAVVQNVPEITAPDAEEQRWIYGAATWRGIDPDADFFKVILTGFSNGYEIRQDDGVSRVWRKVVIQRFARPGDRYDPSQREFQFVGNPVWDFRPEEKQIPAASASR